MIPVPRYLTAVEHAREEGCQVTQVSDVKDDSCAFVITKGAAATWVLAVSNGRSVHEVELTRFSAAKLLNQLSTWLAETPEGDA